MYAKLPAQCLPYDRQFISVLLHSLPSSAPGIQCPPSLYGSSLFELQNADIQLKLACTNKEKVLAQEREKSKVKLTPGAQIQGLK